MILRDFRLGDEPALRAVFESAIHGVASRDYSPLQVNTWAPRTFDPDAWAARVRAIAPFVVERDAEIVGYADVQPSGYIDHFYVGASAARQGVGALLMRRIEQKARGLGIELLHSHVSLTAQPFFQRFGFVIVEQRRPVVNGVEFSNALMHRKLEVDVDVDVDG